MKLASSIKRLLIIPAVLILAACGSPSQELPDSNVSYLSDPRFATDEFLEDYDTKYLYEEFIGYNAFCESEDAFYFFAYNDDNPSKRAICYYDKVSGASGYLCARPECGHNDQTCNAYVSPYARALSCYDGKLYWVDVDNTVRHCNICCCDLDGFNKKIVNSYEEDVISGKKNERYMIHRGYVYSSYIRDIVKDGETEYAFYVKACALEGDDCYEILNEPCEDPDLFYIQPVGRYLYLIIEHDASNYVTVRRFDTGTREMEDVFEYFYDDNCYVADARVIASEGVYLSLSKNVGKNIVKYDFDSGDITVAFEEYQAVRGFLFTDRAIITRPTLTGDILSFETYDYDCHKQYDVSVNLPMRNEVFPWDATRLYYSNDDFIFLVNDDTILIVSPVAYVSYDGSECGILWKPESTEFFKKN